jgi:hypothetical protein
MLDVILPEQMKVLNNCDLLGLTDVTDSFNTCDETSHVFIQKYKHIPTFGGNSFLVMDPGALLGYAEETFGYTAVDDPWMSHLKDKKVLVISTHAESIKHQWKNIEKIWGHNKDIVAPFELVDVIRSPYHPLMDNRQYPNCNHWGDTVNYMTKLIESYDFDVLLTSSTTSSVFFANHAKEIGKIGIQTGGVLQLYFGILGFRWTNKVSVYRNWHNMYNEHWMYPLQIDEAQNRKNALHLETNFAYW